MNKAFVVGLLDNNKSAQMYEGLLIKPSNVELLGNSPAKEG